MNPIVRGESAAFPLSDLKLGHAAVVKHFTLPDADANRLMQLGFLPGSTVTYRQRSPFGDPSVYHVEGTDVALRRETAEQVYVARTGASE